MIQDMFAIFFGHNSVFYNFKNWEIQITDTCVTFHYFFNLYTLVYLLILYHLSLIVGNSNLEDKWLKI